MPSCIQVAGLTKCYGSTVAVSGLSFEVMPGEILGLLGPNGAGKSTTLHMLSGLVRPTSGSVAVFGRDLRKHYIEVAARMGVLVERPAFFDRTESGQNLLRSLGFLGAPRFDAHVAKYRLTKKWITAESGQPP